MRKKRPIQNMMRAERRRATSQRQAPSCKPIAPRNASCLKDTVGIAAHIAQVFLVAVAVFGYFYTIMPIYKKELLADRVARQEQAVTGLELRNRQVVDQIRENSQTLDELYGDIAKSRDHLASLQNAIEGLTRENAKVLEENAKAIRDKKEIEIEVAYLRDEAAANRKALLAVETNLSQKYRAIFHESMEDYAVAQFLALQKNRPGDGKDKRAVDIITEYKDKTIPVSVLIEKSLNAYDQRLSKSYTMIPAAVRKKLADESKSTLAKRDDLKIVPFDTAKVVAILNERDNRIFALPADLPQSERVTLVVRIGLEYNKKLTDLIAEFKHDYIREVRQFFEG